MPWIELAQRTAGRSGGLRKISHTRRVALAVMLVAGGAGLTACNGTAASALHSTATTAPGSTPAKASANGALVWSAPVSIDPNNNDGAEISCAGQDFCIVVTGEGEALTWNGNSWSSAQGIPGLGPVHSISCPTVEFCVAGGEGGTVGTWNGSWSVEQAADIPTDQSGDNFAAVFVSCVSADFCMAVTADGYSFHFNGSSWSTAYLVTSQGLNGVSCTATDSCMAFTPDRQVTQWTGTSWSQPQEIDATGNPADSISALSCSSTDFCVAGDLDGNVVRWDGTSWSAPLLIDQGQEIMDVSCGTPRFCVASDNIGQALTWGGSSWSKPTTIDPAPPYHTNNSLQISMSCAGSNFCMGVDQTTLAMIGRT